MSFIPKLNAVKARLQNNQALNDYCQTQFNKPLKVRRVFRNRVELDISKDLPVIMITRPRVVRSTANGVISKSHSVYLYIGILQNDPEKAQDNVVEMDELVEAAIPEYTRQQGDVPLAVSVEDSANDEGLYHPVYFSVMHLTIKDR